MRLTDPLQEVKEAAKRIADRSDLNIEQKHYLLNQGAAILSLVATNLMTGLYKVPSTDAERAKLRPDNFKDLSPEAQWKIDKELGILDWDGT